MNAQETLKNTRLYTDERDYLLVGLPPQAITVAAGVLAEIGEPFAALLVDKDEVTLVIDAEDYAEFSGRLPGARASTAYRLITLDAELPPDLTGFMALVAGLLAAANIPIIPLGAFSRDHVLVPSAQFAAAWATLEGYQTS